MKRCLKLAVVCFLCAVGFAGSSNAAWPLQTRFDWLRAQLVVTRALVGHVPGVETKTDVAKCRVAIRTGGGK